MQKIMFNDKYGLTKAVLNEEKTQTRRFVKIPKKFNGIEVYSFVKYVNKKGDWFTELCDADERCIENSYLKSTYQIDEIIAIAQNYKDIGLDPDKVVQIKKDGTPIKAIESKGWNNKMFVKAELMPHHIKITNIRLQKLQEISSEDCLSEGIQYPEVDYGEPITGFSFINANNAYETPQQAYACLIDKLGKKGTWKKNEWVWAYTFILID